MVLGLGLESLPAANTTSPPCWLTNGLYAASNAWFRLAFVVSQVMPPQELFITFTPELIKCWLTWPKNCASCPVTVDGGVLPLSSGALSSMMRSDTRSAPGAIPPGNCANGAPAAISDTQVPWPTTSSMLVLLVLGSTSMYSCRTRPATVGLLRMIPLSTTPIVTPAPV